MNCKNCNAVMQIDQARKMYVCPYCDSVEPMNAFTDQGIKDELKGIVSEAIRDANQSSGGNVAAYQDRRSKAQKTRDLLIMVMQIVFCVILGLLSTMILVDDARVAGYISLTQMILLIVAMVNKSKFHHTGNEKARKTAKICVTTVSLLIIAWVVAVAISMNEDGSGSGSGKNKWPTSGIGSQLPQMPGNIEYSYSNKNDFNANSKGNSASDFDDYVAKCKNAGFNIDIEETDDKFLAYDKDDNKLEICFRDYSDRIDVSLEKGIVMQPFQWSTQGIAGEVPEPKAENSYLKTLRNDNYERFEIYVGDVTQEQFMDYVNKCMEAGYVGRIDKNQKFEGKRERTAAAEDASAKEKSYVRLKVELQRGRIIYIEAYESNY